MSAVTSIVVKSLPAANLAAMSEPASGFDADFGPIFARLYPLLYGELERLGIASTGPQAAMYLERPDAQIDVVAAAPVAPDTNVDSQLVTVVSLPAVPRAATL